MSWRTDIKRITWAHNSTRSIAIRLFLTCWLIYVLHFATNTVREIYPALSLGDHFSVNVSQYLGLHPDIFAIPGRGAFINNNPGASFMGAVPYALARPLIDQAVERIQTARQASHQPPPEYKTIYPMARDFFREAFERGLDVKFGLAAGAMQALLMAPLSALSVVVMFYILLSLTGSPRRALWLAVLYGFATPVFYRTAQLNQNLLIADCALFAFALLWRPWDDPSKPHKPNYLFAGLLTGWTLVLDYSGVVVVAALGFYSLVRWYQFPGAARSRLDLGRFAAGIAICIGILMGYQWIAFGNPFYPAQRYMPPTQYSGYGFNGMGLPQADLLWDTALGIHFGLFAFAPLLFLALYAPAWFNPRLRLVGKRETLFILLLSILTFLFASANQYGRLQFNSGVRYVLPAVPFLFLLAAGVLIRLPHTIAIGVGMVTTYWSWCLAMYRDVEQAGGVLDSILHISLEGPRLPWLTTLQNLGMVSGNALTIALLVATAIGLWLIWNVRVPPFVRIVNQPNPERSS